MGEHSHPLSGSRERTPELLKLPSEQAPNIIPGTLILEIFRRKT
jgi:hypothetical protein